MPWVFIFIALFKLQYKINKYDKFLYSILGKVSDS